MHRAALGSGVVALALGITALWAETNEALLALFIAATVVTWALGEIAHVLGSVTAGWPMAHQA